MLRKLGHFLSLKAESEKFKKGLRVAQATSDLKKEIRESMGVKKRKLEEFEFSFKNEQIIVYCPDRMWIQEMNLNSSSLREAANRNLESKLVTEVRIKQKKYYSSET